MYIILTRINWSWRLNEKIPVKLLLFKINYIIIKFHTIKNRHFKIYLFTKSRMLCITSLIQWHCVTSQLARSITPCLSTIITRDHIRGRLHESSNTWSSFQTRVFNEFSNTSLQTLAWNSLQTRGFVSAPRVNPRVNKKKSLRILFWV